MPNKEIKNKINICDLNKVVRFMMGDFKRYRHWKKTNPRLQFTYSIAPNAKSLISTVEKRYVKGSSSTFTYEDFVTVTDIQLDAFYEATRSFQDIIHTDFHLVQDSVNKDTNANIRLYNAYMNSHHYFYVVGRYTPKMVGKNLTSAIGINHYYYKKALTNKKDNGYDDMLDTMRHELGHVFGLRDTQESIIDGQEFDNTDYTVMSYNGGTKNSLMLFDILTLQAYYGANNHTERKNNVYYFNDYCCIWDAGGIDKLIVNNGVKTVNLIDGNPQIAYNTHIENIDVNSGDNFVFLNSLNNNINDTRDDNVYYFSDKTVITKIEPKMVKNKISQKITKGIKANGIQYTGWGQDIYTHTNQCQNAAFIFDVDDVAGFGFYSDNGKDLVIKHTSKSSLRIKNFKKRAEHNIIGIRAKSYKAWKEIHDKYPEHIKLGYQNLKNIKHTNPLSVDNGLNLLKNGSASKVIALRDRTVSFISKKPVQKTYGYIPLSFKWDVIKNNKLKERVHIVKPLQNGQILSQSEGYVIYIPSKKQDVLGRIIPHDSARGIADNKEYKVTISSHDIRGKQQSTKTVTLSGYMLKTFNIAPIQNGNSYTITILDKNGGIYENFYLYARNKFKKPKVFGKSPAYIVKGKFLELYKLFRKDVIKVCDVNLKDQMTLKNKKGQILRGWQSTKNPESLRLHWNGSGAGILRAIRHMPNKALPKVEYVVVNFTGN